MILKYWRCGSIYLLAPFFIVQILSVTLRHEVYSISFYIGYYNSSRSRVKVGYLKAKKKQNKKNNLKVLWGKFKNSAI